VEVVQFGGLTGFLDLRSSFDGNPSACLLDLADGACLGWLLLLGHLTKYLGACRGGDFFIFVCWYSQQSEPESKFYSHEKWAKRVPRNPLLRHEQIHLFLGRDSFTILAVRWLSLGEFNLSSWICLNPGWEWNRVKREVNIDENQRGVEDSYVGGGFAYGIEWKLLQSVMVTIWNGLKDIYVNPREIKIKSTIIHYESSMPITLTHSPLNS